MYFVSHKKEKEKLFFKNLFLIRVVNINLQEIKIKKTLNYLYYLLCVLKSVTCRQRFSFLSENVMCYLFELNLKCNFIFI